MPRRRNLKRYNPRRRKRFKRRKPKSNFNRRTGTGIGRLMPLPRRWTFKTRYVENNLSIDPGVAQNAEHLFKFNSLYDPDGTYVGHQPLGFDQFSPLYTTYTVIGCRARITLTNTDPNHPQNFYLFPSSTGSSMIGDAQLEVMTERGACRWCQLAPAGSGGCTKTLTINWSAKKHFGKSPFDDDTCSAPFTSNPVNVAWLHASVQPLGAGAENPLPCVGAAVLEYIAVLTEPKPMPQS